MRTNVYNKTSFIFRFITLVVAAASTLFLFYVVYQSNVSLDISKTQVGSIYLGETDVEEFPLEISKGFVDWKQQVNYTITYQEYKLKMDPSLFHLNLSTTVDQIKLNETNQVSATILPEELELFKEDLITAFREDVVENLDLETLTIDLLKEVSSLNTYQVFSLSNYLVDDYKNTVVSSILMEPISIDVQNDLLTTKGFTIPAEANFSILEAFQDSGLTNNELSIIASATKTMIQQSNLVNVYSHPFEILPEWADVGNNVRILKNSDYDLTFYNPNDYDINVSISKTEGGLLFELLSYPYLSSYSTNIFRTANIPYDSILRENEELTINTEGAEVIESLDSYKVTLTVQEGKPGSIYEIYREITRIDGSKYIELFEKEYYRPQTEITEERVIPKGEEN